MKKLIKQTLKAQMAVVLSIASLLVPDNATAAGPEPVVIYKVTTHEKTLVMLEDVYQKFSTKSDYYLIVRPEMNTYRIVRLHSGRKYRIGDEAEFMSQSFVSTDASGRERRILSFHGPGLEWDVRDDPGSDQAVLETMIGRVKRIESKLYSAAFEMRAPTLLKGKGLFEYSHAASQRRETSTSNTSIRLSRRLTNLANAHGGGLRDSQLTVAEYLRARGWENLFGEADNNNGGIINL